MKNSLLGGFRAAVLAATMLSVVAPPALAQVPSFSPPTLQRPTYASGFSITPAGLTLGDYACVKGSAGQNTWLSHVRVSGFDGTAQNVVVNLMIRTVADTGGTSTSPASVPLTPNASNPAESTVLAYTVPPTPGTGAAIRSAVLGLPATPTAGVAVEWNFQPQTDLTQQPTIQGVAQEYCINFPAAFSTAVPTLSIEFGWTE